MSIRFVSFSLISGLNKNEKKLFVSTNKKFFPTWGSLLVVMVIYRSFFLHFLEKEPSILVLVFFSCRTVFRSLMTIGEKIKCIAKFVTDKNVERNSIGVNKFNGFKPREEKAVISLFFFRFVTTMKADIKVVIEIAIGKDRHKNTFNNNKSSWISMPETKYLVSLDSLKKIEMLTKKKVKKNIFNRKFRVIIFQCIGIFFDVLYK